MKKIKFLLIYLYCCSLSACFTPPNSDPVNVANGNYTLDPAHTSIIWRIKHAGLSNYTARFDKISGVLSFDPQHPENSQIDIRVVTASVNTGDPEFDAEIGLKGKYFDGKDHPEIRFVSTTINLTGKNTGIITGNLSFRGQTHPVSLRAVFNGAGKSFGHKGQTLGFSATASFKRSDFGLSTLIPFGIADEVNLAIETEFNEN